MVGMRGFEPPTTCTPSRCATRLRYIPIADSRSIIPVEESQYCAQLLAHLDQGRLDLVVAVAGGRRLGLARLGRRRVHPPRQLRLEPLLGAGDRETFLVEELLDAQHGLDVAPPVDPLPRAVLRRRQRRELRLPVAQHVGLGVGDLAHLADLEEQLVRDLPFHRGAPGVYSEAPPNNLEGRKTTDLRGLISISSPVWGLRPRRSRFWRITNVPKPVIWTFSPSPRRFLMESKMISTSLAASRFERPP